MNLREFWQAEADKLRDTSHLLPNVATVEERYNQKENNVKIPKFYFKRKDSLNYEFVKEENYVETPWKNGVRDREQPRIKDRDQICKMYLRNKEEKNYTEYTINSVQTMYGRNASKEIKGNFSGIVELTEKDLIGILGFGRYVFTKRYSASEPKEVIVLRESVGGWLDFKNTFFSKINANKINRSSLTKINGIVYNPNELGNYLWAMVLVFEGIFISPNTIAQIGTKEGDDEPWEQRAINEGKKQGEKFPTYAQNKEFYDDLYHYVEFYFEEYKKDKL